MGRVPVARRLSHDTDANTCAAAAKARQRRRGARGHANTPLTDGAAWRMAYSAGIELLRATAANHSALRLGMRRWVPYSVNTRPNRFE